MPVFACGRLGRETRTVCDEFPAAARHLYNIVYRAARVGENGKRTVRFQLPREASHEVLLLLLTSRVDLPDELSVENVTR